MEIKLRQHPPHPSFGDLSVENPKQIVTFEVLKESMLQKKKESDIHNKVRIGHSVEILRICICGGYFAGVQAKYVYWEMGWSPLSPHNDATISDNFVYS